MQLMYFVLGLWQQWRVSKQVDSRNIEANVLISLQIVPASQKLNPDAHLPSSLGYVCRFDKSSNGYKFISSL